MILVEEHRSTEILGDVLSKVFPEDDSARPAIDDLLEYMKFGEGTSFAEFLKKKLIQELGLAGKTSQQANDAVAGPLKSRTRYFRERRQKAIRRLKRFFKRHVLPFRISIPPVRSGRPAKDLAKDSPKKWKPPHRVAIEPNPDYPSYMSLFRQHLPYLPGETPEVHFIVDFEIGQGAGELALRLTTMFAEAGCKVHSNGGNTNIKARTLVIGSSLRRADLAELYPPNFSLRPAVSEISKVQGCKIVPVVFSQFRFQALDSDCFIVFCDVPDSEAAFGLLSLMSAEKPQEFAKVFNLDRSLLFPDEFQIKLQFSIRNNEVQGRARMLEYVDGQKRPAGSSSEAVAAPALSIVSG